ncbi:hypothetical protein [Streptomyces sp. NBC_00091]|uniref:hypothetical protein n=1 Tax=Streptomyces sp. NBC_00091 TaxID=2975648 RepID=UPI00225338A6|nr:hypothetical protein [Streptomyces sp. NBC_00091]MCX5380344.1 hypothetical protein [Streptomyces sp. NBC_00091]
MSLIRTTPPRPLDVTAVFPQLAPLARTATRLHPRRGAPSPHDSSVGGPLLWPADQPWPYCDFPHLDGGFSLDVVRLEQRIRAGTETNPYRAPGVSPYTPQEEQAAWEQIDFDLPLPDGPVPMLPLAQLYVRDVPLLRPPGQAGADLLQVLWCPFDHPPETYMPRTALFWRSAAAVTEILTSPPEPPVAEFEEYVPEPCVLAPEQVTEYPNPMELSKELREPLGNWSTWQAADTGVDSYYAPCPEEFYRNELSVAPGWKVGGWPSWGYTDPVPRLCPACDTEMDPLLTIDTFEWDSSNRSWIPYEDQAAASPTDHRYRDLRQPTAVQIGSGYKQQIYICPAAPEHPHTELMQ